MEYYIEYPVACQTCNENVACHVEDFLQLKSIGMSEENALNELGIDLYCTRLAFRGTCVPFNMEHRKAIEGIISVTEASYETANDVSIGKASFGTCNDYNNQMKGKGSKMISTSSSSAAPSVAKVTISRFNVGKNTEKKLAETVPETFNAPIELNVVEQTTFEKPTLPGIPTFNPRKGIPQEIVIVGENNKVKILTGRTYLAE